MVAISSAVRRRPTAATQRSTRSPAEGSAVLGWTATRGGSQRECAERAPQDTSLATTSRKRRRGIDDKQSIAREKEEDKRVTPARPQKGSGMTTRACTLCSCVMRQTATRKQFRNAAVNHIASRHVDVRRQKASQTIGLRRSLECATWSRRSRCWMLGFALRTDWLEMFGLRERERLGAADGNAASGPWQAEMSKRLRLHVCKPGPRSSKPWRRTARSMATDLWAKTGWEKNKRGSVLLKGTEALRQQAAKRGHEFHCAAEGPTDPKRETVTVTHSGKLLQHLSPTWPHGREWRGHDPLKKESV